MRRFGIELELVAPSGQEAFALARTVLTGVSIPVHVHRSHLGGEYSMWNAKHDGSIQPQGRGVEIVSRIMPADEASYAEIERAVTALDTAGFGINRSCGFHVHLNVSDLPFHVRQLIVLRYAQLQADISAMMPESRRSNSYCHALSDAQRRELANNITRGNNDVPSIGKFATTNMNYMDRAGGDARIEFRQAAGTCNAAKVVGWVRFLQEMVDEVARRAAGVRFVDRIAGDAAARGIPAAPRPTPVAVNPLSRVPRMRPGSDNYAAAEQLRNTGALTAAWAAERNIVEPTLRRMIVGFRRHGAQITTVRTSTGPVYTLAGARTLPVSLQDMFAVPAVAVAPAPVAAPVVAPTPAPVEAVVRPAYFVSYDFNAGLSVATVAWVRDRRDTFNASSEAA